MQRLITMTLTMLALAGSAQAQTVTRTNETSNKAYLRTGVEPTTMLTVGVQRSFRLAPLDRDITPYTEWGTSVVRPGWGNSELTVGATMVAVEYGRLKLVNRLFVTAGAVETINFDSKRFAVGDAIAAGFYDRIWFVAGTVEYEHNVINRIDHTDHYRTAFYEDAEDGWYSGAGGTVQFGIEGGVTLLERLDLHLEVKMPFTERFASYNGSPLHANFVTGYRF